MRDTELEHLEQLVAELLELEPAPRAERLRQLCRGGEGIGALAARLIAAHDRNGGELVTPSDAGRVPQGFDPLIDPLVGRRCGDFTLVRVIGMGGAGRVYEARQQAPDRRVAVKVLAAHALAGATAQSRFRREADLLGALDHVGICRIHAAGAAPIGNDLLPFIAMEFVDGSPLDLAAKDFDRTTCLDVVARIADAVHYAHERGIVHRDLKPANILVVAATAGAARQVKILDFGIAMLLAADGASATVRTATGHVLGTLGYMSPEQVAGGSGDQRSDVYALGVILFELLTGRRPFADVPALLASARATADHPAPLLRTFVRELRGDLEAVVARALESDPQRRYQSAAELAEDLRNVVAARPVHARRPSPWYRATRWLRRHRLLSAMFVLLAVSLAIAARAMWSAGLSHEQLVATAHARRFEVYTGLLHEAVAAVETGDAAVGRAVLDRIDPDLRGWEWRYVAASAERVEQVAAQGRRPTDDHSATLVTVLDARMQEPFHDLGSWNAETRTFDLVDIRDQSKQASVPGLAWRPWRFAVTPTRSHLVLAGMPEHALEVHDLASGQCVARRDGFNAEDNHLHIDPGGTMVAMAGESGVVRFFRLPGLEPWSEWKVPGRVNAMAFAPGGERMVVAWAPDGQAVFDTKTGAPVCHCETRGELPIYTVFTDDGKRLVSLNFRAPNLNLWDAATGRLLRRQSIFEGPLSLVRIPGAARVAVGASDGGVRIFDTGVPEDGPWMPLLTLRDEGAAIVWMSAARDGTALLAMTNTGHLQLWQVPSAVTPR